MGCSDDEIQEAVQCAYSVGAGVMWAMAARAEKASNDRFRWWDKRSVQRAVAEGNAPSEPGTTSGTT